MRKTIVMIALEISLISTKRAEKAVNIVFDNNLDGKIVFSSRKNSDILENVILEKSYYGARFKYFVRNIIKTDTLTRADLYFYLSKDMTFYTFYFLRPIKFDTLTNNYVFIKNMIVLVLIRKIFILRMKSILHLYTLIRK